MKRLPLTLFSISTAFFTAGIAVRAEVSPEQEKFFEEKIRPVLAKHCFKCHSDKEDKRKGGLVMDSKAGLQAGGSSGYVIQAGDPDASLLFNAISRGNEDTAMPPDYALSAREVGDFAAWIKMGAPDPRKEEGSASVVNWRNPDVARDFWSFRQPVESPLPAVKDAAWPRSEIDRFVLAKIEERGLRVVADADKATLVRRAYFDLLGLPPSPRTVENFTKSTDSSAFSRLVDLLMESESFGEKWGRQWLDVARYAESTGKEVNITFPHAWRYRDYVIKSFNQDKPYDRFIQEQVAGDLLYAESNVEKADLLVATGFLAMGPKSMNEMNRVQFQMDLVDEQIDTLSQAILGVTVACARCHDHKFDPISQREYYAMAGIFLSTDTYYGTVSQQGNRRASELIPLPIKEQAFAGRKMTAFERRRLEQSLEDSLAERSKLFAEVRNARNRGGAGMDQAETRQTLLRLNGRIAMAENRLDSVDKDGNPLAFAMGVKDSQRVTNARVLDRGEVDSPKEFIQRGFVSVISGDQPPRIPNSRSGRKELAEWLTADDNPLFARVMVNRIWSWLMGRGIVETVDNFGVNGQRPSHPELLDWLAIRFKSNGYSVKKTIKDIMLSRAYQLASTFDARNFDKDPGNIHYWRKSQRRLQAEEIRDAILAVSGELRFDAPRGSEVSYKGDGIVGRGPAAITENDVLGESLGSYRSIYLPVVRDVLPEIFNVFDYADASLVSGRRDTTIVPGQALFFMNSPFVLRQSAKTADRVLAEKETGGERIHHLYMLTLGRAPTASEIGIAQRYFEEFPGVAGGAGKRAALDTFCQSLFACAEFRHVN
ncbi:MAG: PSD1 domain-containing protein [Verrucomicrobiae bacterium]|jgi:hypothetical protein|nr:PSD1 domain-containing protein [Verrucomicrobiae bacterium]